MKYLLKLEESALFVLCLYVFSLLDFPWYYFPVLLFLPDLSMLGYLAGNGVGAKVYNLLHHKGLAILVGIASFALEYPLGTLAGVILLAHSSLDRLLGYGLKYSTGFQDTHLGRIGKEAK